MALGVIGLGFGMIWIAGALRKARYRQNASMGFDTCILPIREDNLTNLLAHFGPFLNCRLFGIQGKS